ncbi:OstA-like protein [Pedobacter sandarakinus]|uniref:OstA-like protein n=1 Tax=Pedobacter sandarakinus TaxID=353156 RepID=UPI00224689ED|nr:OstA-like protein [Pedobacter sandarakinus]MCX2573193.1 hypothetical protein [Pedobacter sandarakinus]
MQKLFVFLFLSIAPFIVFGQQVGSKIKIVSYSKIRGDVKNKINYLRNPVFQQDNATLSCDSAVFYSERNYFEAYQNVHINQLTTDIYSDQLEYDGNKKQAHLTGNVRMVDPTTVLTTNILDYNTLSKIGTYTSGGKIVNQQVTLTSKNGYYFNTTSDAYFRYDVVVVTPQVTIKSDTMRYNTQTKWTYFYGPTNIKGKDDNLYTENGAYNTMTEDAYFGKKNLYTQGTRSLKGDSLYYFGKVGYGKAVKNIVFSDTKDKMKMFGDLGYYYKADQRTLVTRNAYLGIGTEDSIEVKGKKRPDSLWMGADTLETQMVLQKTLKLIPKISIKADNEIGEDDEAEPKEKPERSASQAVAGKATEATPRKTPASKNKRGKADKNAVGGTGEMKNITDSTIVKVDSATKKIITKDLDSLGKSKILKTADSIKQKLITKGADSLVVRGKNAISGDPQKIKTVTDSLAKNTGKLVAKTVNSKTLGGLQAGISKNDTTKFNPADTVQARIIKAYHGVKIFKTNIQAKTDSLFYTSADSTLRCYQNPMIWSEGSQQIADTIYVQFKNKKLNNLQAIRNAFLVNTPKDSLRFNQIKGRLMTGFFNKGKLKTMYVDGNAESIYYTQDDSTKVYKEMNQTLSSRIKFIFQDNENDIQDIVYIKGVEGALNPESKIEKDHVLKGFSWKPTERPKSKKDAIGSSGKAKPKPKSTPGAKAPAKSVTTPKKPIAILKIPAEKRNTPKADSSSKQVPQIKLIDTNKVGMKPVLQKTDTTKLKEVN